jgi:hypothetical protein
MSDRSEHLQYISDLGVAYPYERNVAELRAGELPTHWWPRLWRAYRHVWMVVIQLYFKIEQIVDPEGETSLDYHFGSGPRPGRL